MSQSKGTSLDIGVGTISRASGRGNYRASYHNVFKGKNWLGSKPYLEQPKDNTGLIFIARTDMNLIGDNIRGHRLFEGLLSRNKYSAGAAIQSMLDPRLSRRGYASPLIDPYYGFMPLVDNTVVSCTGWPSNVVDVTPTPPNEKGGSSLVIEGKYKTGKEYDLSIEHLNTEGDLLSQFYQVMTLYPLLLRNDEVQMYPDNVVLDRCDWKSRIYRFVLDKTATRVEQFTMTGEAFPISDSTGNAMNYNSDTAVNEGYDTISANWKCGGFFHNDPIVIDDFNRTQQMHNPDMTDAYREERMYRVGSDEGLPSLAVCEIYQYLGYPRINPLTLEFEIWVPNMMQGVIKEYSNTEEFVNAMIKKNDTDIFTGNKEYDQIALLKAIGLTFDVSPKEAISTARAAEEQEKGANT